ncbi:NADH kinase pos5 [Clarireedia jacksonii]
MMIARALRGGYILQKRTFSSTAARPEILDARDLPNRIVPKYQQDRSSNLLSLHWPSPPRNILFVGKEDAPSVTEALAEYACHVHSNYDVSLIFEPNFANSIHESLPFPIYSSTDPTVFPKLVDMVTTLGGDGTILHASSLFSSSLHVPPMLSFSMGTLGFLGEWKFAEYKRAFREVYMSGGEAGSHLLKDQKHPHVQVSNDNKEDMTSWSNVRGKSMGSTRGSKILLRSRLKVGIYDSFGAPIRSGLKNRPDRDTYAMNEVVIHRGREAHLVIVEVFVGGRFLTEAVADGMIISTPTGSTAYNLSSGGSIIHPLVSSLLLTPICPRSLSFRPLVLPANTPIVLRLSEKNRSRELEVSIDGRRKNFAAGLGLKRFVGAEVGMEVRVEGEELIKGKEWCGGVPCVVRGAKLGTDDDDGWVGGLNGLLKFNYPFGEE